MRNCGGDREKRWHKADGRLSGEAPPKRWSRVACRAAGPTHSGGVLRSDPIGPSPRPTRYPARARINEFGFVKRECDLSGAEQVDQFCPGHPYARDDNGRLIVSVVPTPPSPSGESRTDRGAA